METTYIVTRGQGPKMLFSFTDAGIFTKLELHGGLNDEQFAWLLKYFPQTDEQLFRWRGLGFRVEQAVSDISFEAFYNQYPRKVGKKDAEKAYKMLPENEKILAISGIKRYKQWLNSHPGIEILYPASFIRKERYKDED